VRQPIRPGDANWMIAGRGIVHSERTPLLGGQALGPRFLWWNFVSSSRERIELAKADWKAGRFGTVPGDPEFIPLPEERKPKVDYP
jgi:hypothetical protein